MGFRKAAGLSGPSREPMSSRRAHRNNTEKSACEAWDLLISTGKKRYNFRKDLFLFFWRSPNYDRKNRYNFREDLFFSFFFGDHVIIGQNCDIFYVCFGVHKPEIRHYWAGQGPTFGSRRPWQHVQTLLHRRRINRLSDNLLPLGKTSTDERTEICSGWRNMPSGAWGTLYS